MMSALSFFPALVLRTPLFSFSDRRSSEELLNDPVFRRAVFLASEVFYRALEAKHFVYPDLSARERLTLEKYVNRACFRPTPFGLFAAVSAVPWHDGAGRMVVAGPAELDLHLLPDHSTMLSENTLRRNKQLARYAINPTWYAAGKEFRYIRSDRAESGKVHFMLDSIERNPLTRRLCKWLSEGPVRGLSVIDFLLNSTGCTEEDAGEYLQFLIEAQIICATDTINIIGDAAGRDPAKGPMSYDIPTVRGRTFYANAMRKAKDGLSLGYQEELRAALDALAKLTPVHSVPYLDEFARAFSARFEGQKIPLMEALDPETGVGYGPFAKAGEGRGLLKGLRFNEPESDKPLIPWTDTNRILLAKWQAMASADTILRITSADLESIVAADKPLPPSLAMMFRHTRDGLLIENAGGVTGTALIGRFTVFSPEIHDMAKKIARQEQLANPGVVFADIGQLSDSHTDNINRRQAIYEYEIPINCASLLSHDRQIYPSDLLVSVRSGVVILESRQLEKRVIPRLTTAYNFRHNHLSVFRFLCDLQYQHLHSDFSFSLENYFPGMDAYPRVQFENTILSPARWYFRNEHGQQNAASLKKVPGIPPYISLTHADKQLIFNLEDLAQQAFFNECISGMQAFTIQEALLPDPEDALVKLAGGEPMVNQFISILTNTNKVYENSSFRRPVHLRTGRQFILGSEWLYYKIYCSPETSDILLSERIAPVIKQLGKTGRPEWFFIRYADPGYHLRLRIKLDGAQLGFAVALLKRQFSDLVRDRIVREFTADTYRREVERYGTEMITAVEVFFHASSEWILNFLEQKGKHPHDDDRFAIEGFRMILDEMIGDGDKKIVFLKQVSERFLAEFSADKALRVGLDTLYREKRHVLFCDPGVVEGKLKDRFETALQEIGRRSAGFPDKRKESLAADLIHMHINRLYRDQQRRHELALYYCIHKNALAIRGKAKKDHV